MFVLYLNTIAITIAKGSCMSSKRLLWIGYTPETTNLWRRALETELDEVVVDVIPGGREALIALSKAPAGHLIVIIDLKTAGMDLATLVTSIKQINPAIEAVVLDEHELDWSRLNLPKYYRPIFLDASCGTEALISCVAKLQEMVEAKEDYQQLSRSIGDKIGMSRTSTEAILALLNRQNSLGVLSIRRDGFFSSYNEEAQRLTGYDLEEIAHVQVWAQALLLDYESVRALLAAIEKFWAQKVGRENMRLKIRHRDGRIIVLSVTVVVLLDNLGQARQLVALFFDPMERLAAREYDILMDSGACGIYTYHSERGFLKVSSLALALLNRSFSLNLTVNDVLNRKITDLPLPVEMASSWQNLMDEIASRERPLKEGFSPMGLPGRKMMEHAFGARVRINSKESFAVLAVVLPREDLMSVALQDLPTEELAEKTLNAIPSPFVLLRGMRNDDGVIREFVCLMMNPAATELLGVHASSQDYLCLTDLFGDTEAGKMIQECAEEIAETGGHRTFEIRLSLKPGEPEKALLRLWLGKVGDGVALFFEDVTAERDEQQHLRQYRHIFSYMEEAIIVTDLEGNIIDWNPASEKMFGYTKPQILGRPAFILTQNTKGAQLEPRPGQILREGDVWKGEYEFIRNDGTKGIAFSVFALLKDDQGSAYGTVGLCHDLTDRKRLEERLTLKSQELEEKNLALNTLLRYAEAERVRACEQVAADLSRKIHQRVRRILDGKKNAQAVETQATLLLKELGQRDQNKQLDNDDPILKLSEKELEVAQLIRLGKTTEEIAFLLDKSPDTIRLQRISIRKKLGLTRRDSNLASRLRTISLP